MTWWKRALVLLTVMGAVVVGLQHVRNSLVQQGRDDMRRQINEGANERIREALRAGGQQAQRAQADVRQARDFAQALQQELRHGTNPLAVAPERLSASCDVPSGAARASTNDASDATDAGPTRPTVDGGLRLTGRAVSLWDSALAGVGVPAGACRADDPTAAPCAAATDYSLEAAISNHIENAALCREDRARHARLIEYLQQRQASQAQH